MPALTRPPGPLRSAAFAFVATPQLLAGPLDPPAGPVAPSLKTLDQIEPRIPIGPDTTPGDADSVFRITEPGSYYLTGNVAGEPMKHGIEIDAPSVTLDLMGFSMTGGADSMTAVSIEPGGLFPHLGIAIRNGAIESWGVRGIYAFNAPGVVIEDVNCTLCLVKGIRTGDHATLRNCSASFGAGITGGEGCIVRDCRVSFINTGTGFEFLGAAILDRCVADDCSSFGFVADSGSRLTDCVAMRNGVVGFACFSSSLVGCGAIENDSDGFTCLGSSLVACQARNNGSRGFVLDDCVAHSCTAYSNDAAGMSAENSHVESCLATNNDGNGFQALLGSTITRCTSISNGTDASDAGITGNSACYIVANNCVGNSGPGIRVFGREGLIDGNRVANNDIGIEVLDDRNLIVRNICRDNRPNYNIVASNRVGPIIAAPLSGAITGDTDPDVAGVGTSSPWANLNY